jgi:hypothetical protein
MKHKFLFFYFFAFCTLGNVSAQLFDFFKSDKTKVQKSKQNDSGENLEPEKYFSYRGFTLGKDVDVSALDPQNPPKGFSKYITDMEYYETGEDLRMMDILGPMVTLMFDEDTPKLVVIEVENIDDMSVVKQLEGLVIKQLGQPTKGYEIMRNYDGSGTTMWSDYSTYEFVYRYDVGAYSYDFRVTQHGAKMKGKKVVYPYDFSATISPRSNPKKSPHQLIVEQEKQIQEDEKAYSKYLEEEESSEKTNNKKSVEKQPEEDHFYPPIGTIQKDGLTIEVKLLRKF